MAIFLQNERGEQFRIDLKTESMQIIDILLDQLNLGNYTYIKEEDFHIDQPMIVDLMDGNVKVGELICMHVDKQEKLITQNHN